jgi:LysM repeat protein
LQEAVQAFKQTIRLKPDKDMEVMAHCLLARALLDLGDRGGALEEYKILKNLDSNAANDLFDEINRTKKEEQAKPQGPPLELGGTPPPSPEPAPQVPPAPSQLIAQAGDSLGRIANRSYPADNRLGLDALILANPEIDNEGKIFPGQVLFLPEINFPKETIRLKDQRFYAIYGHYQSASSFKIDTSWLEKKQVHFVIRDTTGPRGIVVHRVFLGGYETAEELAEALKSLNLKSP